MRNFKRTPLWLLPPLLAQQTVQAAVELNDASRLNATLVSEVIDIKTENDVRLAILKAQIKQKHISIAGKQHSMGGQTFEKDNIVLNMLSFRGITYQAGRLITRNTVMSPDFRVVWHPVPQSREILQEYFVPYEALDDFITSLRSAVLLQNLNLLNVTLRDVKKDHDVLLSYAKSDVCALVLFFSQPPTAEGEEAMRLFTHKMVDRALSLKGSFYLPYRLTFTPAQFREAYPRAAEFAALKKHIDPNNLFTSQFFHYVYPG